jgi:S1-C subfamily serine protease
MKKLIISLLGLSLILTSTTALALENEETISSVVLIEAIDSLGETYYGTGVIVSSDAVIVTAAHVILDEQTGLPMDYIDVCFLENEFMLPDCQYSGRVNAYDFDLDLAIIDLSYALDDEFNEIGEALTIEDMEALALPYVDFADTRPQLGDKVTVLGFPEPTITLTEGIVSGYVPLTEDIIWQIITTASVNPGNSGGPAYNEEEKIIGIVNEYSVHSAGSFGYIISNDIIQNWFYELVEEDYLLEGWVDEIFSNDSEEDRLDTNLNQIEIFTDVTPSSDNSEAIAYLKNNEIIDGYSDGSFGPDLTLNRAELLKILIESKGISIDAEQYKNCFADVDTDWYAKYVCYAKDEGWIQGYSDNTFKPAQEISKAEAIKILVEVLEITPYTPNEKPFEDVGLYDWYAKYLQTAKKLGILEEDGTYNPNDKILRKQISENIYRTLLIGGEYEKEAFISAVVDSTCATNGFEDQTDENEALVVEIYQNYGIDALDEDDLGILFEKYDYEDVYLEIGLRTQTQCPEVYMNALEELDEEGEGEEELS